LTSPMINIATGINWLTTIIAKQPRKIQTKIPSSPAGTFAAADAEAGTSVPIRASKFSLCPPFSKLEINSEVFTEIIS